MPLRLRSNRTPIEFLNGLSGRPQDTWTSEGGKVFRPANLLPGILEQQEKAHVLVYEYDTQLVLLVDGVFGDKINNLGEHLVAELVENRRLFRATERPIGLLPGRMEDAID